ncbi:MAG: class I SAM-dependent methyltransferase [Deinococcota bacterium]
MNTVSFLEGFSFMPMDEHPFHRYYERPAMLLLLEPAVTTAKTLLDAGCGSGFYSAWAHARDLQVTAVDKELGDVEVPYTRICADLTKPFPLADHAFDVIVCALVLQQLPSLEVCLNEFKRVLAIKGELFISVPHPFETMSAENSYFEVVDTRPQALHRRYHRSLQAYLNAFKQAGLVVVDIAEPQPTELLEEANLELYHTLSKHPGLLIFELTA